MSGASLVHITLLLLLKESFSSPSGPEAATGGRSSFAAAGVARTGQKPDFFLTCNLPSVAEHCAAHAAHFVIWDARSSLGASIRCNMNKAGYIVNLVAASAH